MIRDPRVRVNAALRRCGVLPLCLLASCAGPREPTNVVLIVVDTLRADALGAYGASDRASPTAREVEFRRLLVSKLTVQRSIQQDRWKAIHDRLPDEWRLFDVEADPGERRDLAADEPEVLTRLVDALRDWERLTPTGLADSVALSPADVERLRALGYTR